MAGVACGVTVIVRKHGLRDVSSNAGPNYLTLMLFGDALIKFLSLTRIVDHTRHSNLGSLSVNEKDNSESKGCC